MHALMLYKAAEVQSLFLHESKPKLGKQVHLLFNVNYRVKKDKKYP